MISPFANARAFSPSLRVRLLIAGVLVQTVMLALLIVNGINIMEEKLGERTRAQLDDQKQFLRTVLAPALAARDYASAQRTLDGVRREDGIVYLALFDDSGKVVAASGWDGERPTPVENATSRQRFGEAEFIDTEVAIETEGRKHGILRFGLSTTFMQSARSELVRDNLTIGIVALILSIVSMVGLSYWLTRNLVRLTRASAQVAGGDLDVHLPVESRDEVGRLTQAFNTMAAALQERIRALAESEAKFTAIADYSYDCELWINPEGKLIWVNPRVFDMFGYTPEECLATENFPAPFVSASDVTRTVRQVQRALSGNSGQDYEFRARRKDGSEFWAAADWRPIYDARGGYLGIRISIRDIAQRKQAEQRLEATVAELREAQSVQQQYLTRAQEEHARLSALLAAMDIGILFVSPDQRVVYANPAFSRIWQIDPAARLIDSQPEEVIARAGCTLARPEEQARHVLQTPESGQALGVLEIQMADGRLITQQGYTVEDLHRRPVGHLWLFEDVTRERQTAAQLIYLAERDALTGLFNRHRFNEELARMIADAERNSTRIALFFFDLDDFKYINDTFGHRAGDAMLIRVAGEVGGQVRRNEIFARLGGDEFAVLVPDATDDMVRVLAERVTRSIALVRFQFEGQSLRLTTSLGIAVFPEHADNVEDLVARADTAMYQAKDSGKNAWRVYRSDLDTTLQMVSRLSWNERISHALEHNLMDLQFQGIYETAARTLSHLEVLVRMRDKDDRGSFLMPGQFIPHAERSGKILEIDRWVLRESIQMLAEVPAIPGLAVNISGRSFGEPTLPQYIAEELRQRNVSPQRLLVELTETSAVSDLHDAQRFIEALRQTGCGVSLDDFGTGFSSFAYLKYLQVDSVKIDGLFIRNLPSDYDNQLFVKAIVSVARGLRRTTIAECVEDEETLEMLKAFGVDCVQGYFFEKPRSDHPLLVTSTRSRENLKYRTA
ncbi:MAG TPA: EAL domain-containing protein [Burkholderiales bacterium]|nr:EAL domain-containing protein [Burkholderiales bacterium]